MLNGTPQRGLLKTDGGCGDGQAFVVPKGPATCGESLNWHGITPRIADSLRRRRYRRSVPRVGGTAVARKADIGERAVCAHNGRDGAGCAIADVTDRFRDTGESLSEQGGEVEAEPASSEAAGGEVRWAFPEAVVTLASAMIRAFKAAFLASAFCLERAGSILGPAFRFSHLGMQLSHVIYPPLLVPRAGLGFSGPRGDSVLHCRRPGAFLRCPEFRCHFCFRLAEDVSRCQDRSRSSCYDVLPGLEREGGSQPPVEEERRQGVAHGDRREVGEGAHRRCGDHQRRPLARHVPV